LHEGLQQSLHRQVASGWLLITPVPDDVIIRKKNSTLNRAYISNAPYLNMASVLTKGSGSKYLSRGQTLIMKGE